MGGKTSKGELFAAGEETLDALSYPALALSRGPAPLVDRTLRDLGVLRAQGLGTVRASNRWGFSKIPGGGV